MYYNAYENENDTYNKWTKQKKKIEEETIFRIIFKTLFAFIPSQSHWHALPGVHIHNTSYTHTYSACTTLHPLYDGRFALNELECRKRSRPGNMKGTNGKNIRIRRSPRREREREETQTQYTQYSRRKKNVLRLTFIWLCDIFFHLYRLIQHWYCTHNEHRNVLWMATRTTNSRSSSTYTNTNNRPSSVRYSPALERNHDPMQRIYIYNMYVKWNTSKNCTRDVAMGGCVAALCTKYIIICHWPPLHIIHVMFIAILLWFIYFR